jgi:hypothetical protein
MAPAFQLGVGRRPGPSPTGNSGGEPARQLTFSTKPPVYQFRPDVRAKLLHLPTRPQPFNDHDFKMIRQVR